MKRLVEEISKLHKVNASLQMKYEDSEDELQQLKATKEHLQDNEFLAQDIPPQVSMRYRAYTALQGLIISTHSCDKLLDGGLA